MVLFIKMLTVSLTPLSNLLVAPPLGLYLFTHTANRAQ
ncbi:hypothetical protein C7424_3651 [Pantoea ananatis]|nr:hypothetical protein C7424_3651 [Pantoea ananatis]